ncbi:MAG: helix-turn-helix domain-containing protein [Kiritimatiellae bacterium]|nr:helix-turn-helix domain-containing protein [Kiritimatiellia bacterium]
MLDIGQTLREARERKKVTCSQAASATRMKVQHVEALERNDFKPMAAPTYAKGFIRLYAGYLGLDPGPLIRAYTEQHAAKEPPSLVAEDRNYSRPSLADLASRQARRLWAACRPKLVAWKRPLWIAGLLVLVFIAWRLWRGREKAMPAPPEAVETRAAEPASPRPPLPLLREPPDAYLDDVKPAAERTPPPGPAR